MKKRLLLFLITLLPSFVNASDFDGEGTEDSPFQVKTASDLTNLASLVNSGNSYSGVYFCLTDNIDMTELSFIPIGNQEHPFSGLLDGKGFVIKGISVSGTSELGLFGYTDGAAINDIGIEEVYLDGESHIGGIVGNSQNTTITNCYTRGKTSGNDCVGSLVGYSGQGTIIQNCFSSIQHTRANIYGSVGGLVGYNCGTIENCYFYGTINATTFQEWTTGGIIGYNDTAGKVFNSYFLKASILNSNFDYCGSLNWGQCSGLATFDGSGTTNYGTYLPDLLNNWVVEHKNQGNYRKWSNESFPYFIEYAEREEQEDIPEYVDLGLPSGLLWATKNVGANRPEESGDYFAWGETSPKGEYSWATYKYANGSETSLTKYCNSESYGNVDNKETLDLEDDAATVNLGKTWRTPTLNEIQELREYCSWSRTTINGVNGCKATGPNGNSIFIPSCGVMQFDTRVFTERSCVMSSTYYYEDNSNASVLCCKDPTPEYWYVWDRAWGYNVRPVVNTSSTGIKQAPVNNATEIVGIYDTHGLKQNGFHKGINIVKYKDGTTKKVIKQ